MSLIKRASKGFVWNQSNKTFEFFLTFILSIVIARGLGPFEYGIFCILASINSLFSLFVAQGLEEAIGKYIPKLKADGQNNKIAYLLQRFSIRRVLFTFITCIILYLFSDNIATITKTPQLSSYLRIAIYYLFFGSITALITATFWALLKTKIIAIAKNSIFLVQVILIYIFLKLGFGILSIVYVLIFSAFLSFLVFLFLGRKLFFQKPLSFNIKPLRSFGIIIWLTTFVSYFLGKQTDILLMGYFLVKKSQIGFYNIAYTLVFTLSTFLLMGLSEIALPIYSEVHHKHGNSGIAQVWHFLTKTQMFIIIPIMVFSIHYAKILIPGLYSNQYLPCIILFQTFAIFSLIGTGLGGGGNNKVVLLTIGKERLDLHVRISAGLLNLILDLLLIPRYGAMGAIVATAFSVLACGLAELLFAKKFIKIKFPVLFLGKVTLATLLSVFLTKIFPINNIYMLVGIGTIYGISIIAILFLLKPLTQEDKDILNRINPKLYTLLSKF